MDVVSTFADSALTAVLAYFAVGKGRALSALKGRVEKELSVTLSADCGVEALTAGGQRGFAAETGVG